MQLSIAPVRELSPGAKIGRFWLEREVARGGMGSVWAAREHGPEGTRVALKTVLADRHTAPKLAKLFVEEARISLAVRHPNLLEIYEAGEDAGVPYLVMEWVEGVTVRRLAQRSDGLPLALVLRALMEACDGLHAAHEARTDDGEPLHVVHRDIAPQNLLVSGSGRVKVIDFGIAKAKGRVLEETTQGVLRGRIRYMSPEHALGIPLDRRADVWSLGVTLLELCTGILPFQAENEVAALMKLVSNAEPEVDYHALPPAVAKVVARALRRRPEERYPDARSMGSDLEVILRELGAKHTRRDLGALVKEELETTAKLEKRDIVAAVTREVPGFGPEERPTQKRAHSPLLDAASPETGASVITDKVPSSVIDALVEHELRVLPSVKPAPRSSHPEAIDVEPSQLAVNTSTAVILPTSALDEPGVPSDSGEVAHVRTIEGPSVDESRALSARPRIAARLAVAVVFATLIALTVLGGRAFHGSVVLGTDVPHEPDVPVSVSVAPSVGLPSAPVEAVSIAAVRAPVPSARPSASAAAAASSPVVQGRPSPVRPGSPSIPKPRRADKKPSAELY
jgi:serine/threonine-protein kinase